MPTGGAVSKKRGRPRKTLTAEDVPRNQVKREGKVKVVPRGPGRRAPRLSRQVEEFDDELDRKPRRRAARRDTEVEEFDDMPRRVGRSRATVTPSNYNQTGALGSAIQIRPAFPGVQRPFMVQEFPREYANLSASVNPGIPQYLSATTSPGIPAGYGQNFLTQPGPPQQLPPSAAFNKMLEDYAKMLQQQGQAAQYVAPQIEMRGMAPANIPQIAAPPEESQAFADVPDRAAAPPGQALAVVPRETRQAMAAQGLAPGSTSSTISVNLPRMAEQREREALRNAFVSQSARVQEWNQGVRPSIIPPVVEDMPPALTYGYYDEEGNYRHHGPPAPLTDDIREIMGSEYRSQPPSSLRVGSTDSDSVHTASGLFDTGSYTSSNPFPTTESGGALYGTAGGNPGWYRGTTPTMRAAGDKRLMAQYAPQASAQRHMEQRVDYLGYAGTGLVRSTPVYEAGDVGWAEPPKGAQTINTASYGGRAAVAVRDPNTLKVGQKATTGQTLAQQRLASMYEQRAVSRPALQMSGQPYFDHDVSGVSVRAAPARVMPNSYYSKLRGSK